MSKDSRVVGLVFRSPWVLNGDRRKKVITEIPNQHLDSAKRVKYGLFFQLMISHGGEFLLLSLICIIFFRGQSSSSRPSKRSQGLRRSRSETPLSVQEEEKDTIVHQLSTSRGVKKSLKSLPRGVGKAINSIKHCKTTAGLVPEWFTLYGDDEGPNTEKRA